MGVYFTLSPPSARRSARQQTSNAVRRRTRKKRSAGKTNRRFPPVFLPCLYRPAAGPAAGGNSPCQAWSLASGLMGSRTRSRFQSSEIRHREADVCCCKSVENPGNSLLIFE
jgi:hypothetical protein